jgi:hypothetical protein
LEQLVEQRTASGVGERLEHGFHDVHNRKPYGYLSSCCSPQGGRRPAHALPESGPTTGDVSATVRGIVR